MWWRDWGGVWSHLSTNQRQSHFALPFACQCIVNPPKKLPPDKGHLFLKYTCFYPILLQQSIIYYLQTPLIRGYFHCLHDVPYCVWGMCMVCISWSLQGPSIWAKALPPSGCRLRGDRVRQEIPPREMLHLWAHCTTTWSSGDVTAHHHMILRWCHCTITWSSGACAHVCMPYSHNSWEVFTLN